MTHRQPMFPALQMEATTQPQQARLRIGSYVRRADGRVQQVSRVLRTALSASHGTSVEVVQVELVGDGRYEYVRQYTEAQRQQLARLGATYPAAEFLAAVEG